MSVNTKAVEGRRKLRFNSIDEIVADLDFLEGKKLKSLGNWSVGQNLAHLAIGANGGIDGMDMRVPFFFRLMGKLMKKKMLNGTMPPGFKVKSEYESKLWPANVTEAEGFASLRKALARLKTETHRAPSPFLGPMTVEEFNLLVCRHSELHMSFILPE